MCDIPEASRVNTREVLFILVAIVASACSDSRSTGICNNVVLVLVVNKLLVIVGHVEP